jgi:hypothetical protein
MWSSLRRVLKVGESQRERDGAIVKVSFTCIVLESYWTCCFC